MKLLTSALAIIVVLSISTISKSEVHPRVNVSGCQTLAGNSCIEFHDRFEDDSTSLPLWMAEQAEMMRQVARDNEIWDTTDTTGVSTLSIEEFMQRILPEVSRYAASDSTQVFYNNLMQMRFPMVTNFQESSGDSTLLVRHIFPDTSDTIFVIGKFADNKKTIAVSLFPNDSLVVFYGLENNRWKIIGSDRLEYPDWYPEIFFEPMKSREQNEIVLSSYSNMNGNRFMKVYSYSQEEDSVKFAGEITTMYTVDLSQNPATIQEHYSGSWWMDNTQTLYVWHNDKLVPKRMAVLVVPKDYNIPHAKTYLEYYENPDLITPIDRPQGLELVFRETYRERSKTSKKYWDNFYSLP